MRPLLSRFDSIDSLISAMILITLKYSNKIFQKFIQLVCLSENANFVRFDVMNEQE